MTETSSKNEPPKNEPWPLEIRLHDDGRMLKIGFDDGAEFDLSAEYLRVESPSAELRGHGPRDQKKIIGGCKGINITALDPVGNYAIRPTFADGHNTGLYTWGFLYELGREHAEHWAAYLAAQEDAGLTRE